MGQNRKDLGIPWWTTESEQNRRSLGRSTYFRARSALRVPRPTTFWSQRSFPGPVEGWKYIEPAIGSCPIELKAAERSQHVAQERVPLALPQIQFIRFRLNSSGLWWIQCLGPCWAPAGHGSRLDADIDLARVKWIVHQTGFRKNHGKFPTKPLRNGVTNGVKNALVPKYISLI